jgi:hypothetical protein
MKFQRPQAITITRLAVALLVSSFALTLLIRAGSNSVTARVAQTPAAQDEEKSLDVARYPNAPLELVDLKIHENSVKDKITSKFKDTRNQAGLDNVTFREKTDWFKSVRLRLRNISGRPVYGLNASLLFMDESLKVAFRIPLRQSQARDLMQSPLSSGEEIDLIVDDAKLNQILAYMYKNGVDANQSGWRLSVDAASFGDDFGWQRFANAAEPHRSKEVGRGG